MYIFISRKSVAREKDTPTGKFDKQPYRASLRMKDSGMWFFLLWADRFTN